MQDGDFGFKPDPQRHRRDGWPPFLCLTLDASPVGRQDGATPRRPCHRAGINYPMATENLRAENGNGKRAFAMDENPRIVHLEGRVERVEGDVRDIKIGVQKLLERPQFAGIGQVLTGVLSTLLITGLIFSLAEWRLSVAAAPLARMVEKIETEAEKRREEQHAAEIKAAIQADRLEALREARKAP